MVKELEGEKILTQELQSLISEHADKGLEIKNLNDKVFEHKEFIEKL